MGSTYDFAGLDTVLGRLARQMDAVDAAAADFVDAPSKCDITERFGIHFPIASATATAKRDFVWLGVINYDFLTQRPQHLAAALADLGYRVFYIAIDFEAADERGRFWVESMPRPGLFILKLRLHGAIPPNIYNGFSPAQIADIQSSLSEALLLLNARSPIVVVQYPSWHRVAAGVEGATVVHDCLDYVGGFSNVPPEIVALEQDLIRNADLVVATSAPLAQHIATFRIPTIVRNAADVALFSQAMGLNTHRQGRPIIGYFGAIAEWFSIDWVEEAARARPDWDFLLIGHVQGADVSSIERLPNVTFLGKIAYVDLPKYLANFDVAVIPFKMNELTRCTNPVKLYEYMAAGKPVVASPMPEVVAATDLVYIAHSASEFIAQISKALAEDSLGFQTQRCKWASEHTWQSRATEFIHAVDGVTPLVSIVILSYNQWQFTADCLYSVLKMSNYPNMEVIVVDNASTDCTREELTRMASTDHRINVINNESNLGFAAGNNVGLRAAKGEYVILLNNDTYVTSGWIRDLIRPMVIDPRVGLTGPVTNNIGNEQKVMISYGDMASMAVAARRFTRNHLRKRFATYNLAFFCVAIRRQVLNSVGLLDEAYGLGFFEDDDYCQRVLREGFRIEIVDDVFIHHHLSASFNLLGQHEKDSQMTRNRCIYEKRWGAWQPHRYREALGFG